MASFNYFTNMISNSYQFLRTKLGGDEEDSSGRAKGLMAFCVMLNFFCFILILQSLLNVEVTVAFSTLWKMIAATFVYFAGYVGISYVVKGKDETSLRETKVGGLCALLTSLWILGSIFVIVPFTLYLRAF